VFSVVETPPIEPSIERPRGLRPKSRGLRTLPANDTAPKSAAAKGGVRSNTNRPATRLNDSIGRGRNPGAADVSLLQAGSEELTLGEVSTTTQRR
jgi:hypothetical protein